MWCIPIDTSYLLCRWPAKLTCNCGHNLTDKNTRLLFASYYVLGSSNKVVLCVFVKEKPTVCLFVVGIVEDTMPNCWVYKISCFKLVQIFREYQHLVVGSNWSWKPTCSFHWLEIVDFGTRLVEINKKTQRKRWGGYVICPLSCSPIVWLEKCVSLCDWTIDYMDYTLAWGIFFQVGCFFRGDALYNTFKCITFIANIENLYVNSIGKNCLKD